MTQQQRRSLIRFHERMGAAFTKEGQLAKAQAAYRKADKLREVDDCTDSDGHGVVTDTYGNLLEHY